MISSIEVIEIVEKGYEMPQPVSMRIYSRDRPNRNSRHSESLYSSTAEMMADDAGRAKLLGRARRRIHKFQEDYEDLIDFGHHIEAITNAIDEAAGVAG